MQHFTLITMFANTSNEWALMYLFTNIDIPIYSVTIIYIFINGYSTNINDKNQDYSMLLKTLEVSSLIHQIYIAMNHTRIPII